MRRIDPDDLTDEQRFEMEAAFGREALENGEIVDVTDELRAAEEAGDQ